MTVSSTLRFLLKKFSSGGDPHPTRVEHNAMIDAIENNAAMAAQGATETRPAAGKGRRFYWDQTAKRVYYDDGANWNDTNPNGGGGAGSKVVPGVAAVEGESARSARADHTHTMDLATSTVDGAMAKADKTKLDAATSLATANAIARRDANGRFAVATPTDAAHAATKAYVDGLINDTADYVDAKVGDWEDWQAYTPAWGGFASLGAGWQTGGSYAVIAPGIVRAHAWLRIGAGGGTFSPGFQNVSLPHPPVGYERQVGDGLTMKGAVNGATTMFKLATGPGIITAQLFAWPTPNGYMQTLQSVGLLLAPNDEIHVNMTYRADIS